jgi:hypothetical protein
MQVQKSFSRICSHSLKAILFRHKQSRPAEYSFKSKVAPVSKCFIYISQIALSHAHRLIACMFSSLVCIISKKTVELVRCSLCGSLPDSCFPGSCLNLNKTLAFAAFVMVPLSVFRSHRLFIVLLLDVGHHDPL